TNVPDYPKLAQLWWPNVANAVSGTVTPQTPMDTLAQQQDDVLARLERIGIQGDCGPKLNPETDADEWLGRPGAPKPRLENEKPPGRTVPYDQLIATWQESSV
ncbi:MAG: carbohydrate ABC transporter substrate-binding protein, partial [Gammaproteobacteria bacterium]|nr:carbohydrate ABC transporter substrate-binding protein [Gammaproteobacteria bacterium]